MRPSSLLSPLLSMGLACLFFSGTGCSEKQAVYQPAVSTLLTKADALKKAGQYPEAICRLQAASDLSPELFQVQYNLGVLYIDTTEWPLAIQHLEKALALSPHHANTLYSLGFAHESLAAEYEQGAMSPQNTEDMPATLKGLTPTEAKAKATTAYQDAVKAYEQFLEFAPKSDPARQAVQSALPSLKQKF